MKKLTIIVIMCLIISIISVPGCSSKKTIDGVKYDTYGLLNQSLKMNPDIEYKLCIGNIVWSILLAKSIVAPIYFLGFDIYEPVGKKNKDLPIGGVSN